MKTLLVDSDSHCLSNLETIINRNWPGKASFDKCTHQQRAIEELVKHKYDLLFLNVTQFLNHEIDLRRLVARVRQSIFMADDYEHAALAINSGAAGYLLKPVQEQALNQLVGECFQLPLGLETGHNKATNQYLEDQIICIPTLEGAEFLKPEDIIRCEGLQKCTRIVTHQRSDIISSYNIGIFRELLGDLCFFQPHKSHLINLQCIVKYHRDGTITMKDRSHVPLARRKKNELFELMRCPTNYR